jgi:hypothetical protein
VTFDREIADVEHTAYLLIASSIGDDNPDLFQLRARRKSVRLRNREE